MLNKHHRSDCRIFGDECFRGKFANPKSFSLKTLSFVAQLDQGIAEIFQRYARCVFGGNFIPMFAHEGEDLSELMQLQDFDLIAGVGGILTKPLRIGELGLFLPYQGRILHFSGASGAALNISAMPLTRMGQEIFSILPHSFDLTYLTELIKRFPKGSIDQITLGDVRMIGSEQRYFATDTLWQKEKPKEN